MVILSQSSGTLLDKLARGAGQIPNLILHSLASGYLKFNLTSLFIGTLNMDAFKSKPDFFKTSVGVYCGLDLIWICTLPTLWTFFYFAFLLGSAEIKEYVSSWPAFSKFVQHTAAELLNLLYITSKTHLESYLLCFFF